MHQVGILSKYARHSIPPEARAELFVSGEPRLTWTSLFYNDFPNAEVYLVGGTLRDVILGLIPQDIDLVVRNVEMETLENWLIGHGACDFVGRNFGTFKFVPHGCGEFGPIDIALPRTEEKSENHASGRRDMKVMSDKRLAIKDDLSRRDFTINAMAYEIRHKRLLDPFLGLADLYSGIIRAVLNPERRFQEDATRLLRGLRFASQLGFGIEEHTWHATRDNIDLLNKTRLTEEGTHEFVVAREAIGKEFLLGFVRHPVHTLELWLQSGALERFMPEVAKLDKVIEADGQSALYKTQLALNLMYKPALLMSHEIMRPSPTVMVAALMSFVEHDTAHHAFEICKDYYFHQFAKDHQANVNCSDVLWLLEHLHLFEEVDPASMRPSEFEKHFLNPRGEELLLLMHAFYIAQGKHSVGRERLHLAQRIRQKMNDFFDVAGEDQKLPRLITGKEISEFGIAPGPVYRELIDQIRDAQLTQRIRTPHEAKALLRQLVQEI